MGHPDRDLKSSPIRTERVAQRAAALLAALRWSADNLDPALPPLATYPGAWHPVIAAASRDRLRRLDGCLSVSRRVRMHCVTSKPAHAPVSYAARGSATHQAQALALSAVTGSTVASRYSTT